MITEKDTVRERDRKKRTQKTNKVMFSFLRKLNEEDGNLKLLSSIPRSRKTITNVKSGSNYNFFIFIF